MRILPKLRHPNEEVLVAATYYPETHEYVIHAKRPGILDNPHYEAQHSIYAEQFVRHHDDVFSQLWSMQVRRPHRIDETVWLDANAKLESI